MTLRTDFELSADAVTCFLSDMLIIDNGQPQDGEITFEQDW
ncbi:hypothetical protein [Glycomyces sp. L485]|nr:hypothetical protein [Glycomyces sp. L485]